MAFYEPKTPPSNPVPPGQREPKAPPALQPLRAPYASHPMYRCAFCGGPLAGASCMNCGAPHTTERPPAAPVPSDGTPVRMGDGATVPPEFKYAMTMFLESGRPVTGRPLLEEDLDPLPPPNPLYQTTFQKS